jgi:AmmeMemoRadiSam system protein A
MQISENEKRTLMALARSTLEACFHGDPDKIQVPIDLSTPILLQHLPCFVTLMDHGKLRGCIGCLTTDQSLQDNVHEYVQLAAFSDPRFNRLTESELGEVTIDITVLGPLVPLKKKEDIVIGKHGLSVQKGNRRGVLLAHVATEYGWGVQEFLHHTCEKAGLDPTSFDGYEWNMFEEISFSESE